MNKKVENKLKQLVAVGLIVLGVSSVSDIIATTATYPTSEHKQVAKELSDLTDKMIDGKQPSPAELQRFDKLNQSSEAQYTMGAAMIAGLASFALYVYMVFFSYNRIRKQRLASNARGATVLTVVAASAIAMIPHVVYEYLYAPGVNSYGPNFGFQIITLAVSFVILAVVTILVTMIAESRYNKKHSFIVE